MQGEIVAAGPGARGDDGQPVALDVTVGDTVLFGKYAGTEVTIEGEEYVILREADILGVVEQATAQKKAA